MGLGSWLSSALTGTASDKDWNSTKVNSIDQSNYQIGGLQDYLAGSANRAQQVGNLDQPDLEDNLDQSSQLMKYFGGVANGTQRTAADQMLLTAGQQNAARNQSDVLAGQGQTGAALGFRNLMNANQQNQGNIAAQSATQKLQEQFMGAQAAGQAIQQNAGLQQQRYGNALGNIQAQQDLNNNIFSANQTQTNYRVQGLQNQQALEQYLQQRNDGRLKDKAAGRSKLLGGIIKGVGTAGAALATGGASLGLQGMGAAGGMAAAGGSAPGSLAALAGGTSFRLDPGMLKGRM